MRPSVTWNTVNPSSDLTEEEATLYDMLVEARTTFETAMQKRVNGTGYRLIFAYRSGLAIAKTKGASQRQSLADYLKTH
jgi:hypothetical protein